MESIWSDQILCAICSKYQGVIPAFYACYDDEGAVSATGTGAGA